MGLRRAGIEPAVVGVAVGLCLPATLRWEREGARPRPDRGPRHRERRLEPWVNLMVLPVFALANAGLQVVGSGLGTHDAIVVFVAVVVARLVGKVVGVAGATWGLVHLGDPRRDVRLIGAHRLGVGALAGVGFTVPLLIIRTALPDGPLAAGATAGLLVATVIGVAIGAALFRWPVRGASEVAGVRPAASGKRASGV